MKLLKIRAKGLKLFENEIEIDFYAKKRVSADKNEMLTNVFSNRDTNIYINNVMSVVGINASGKTTALKVISFVMQMLQNERINSIDCNDILKGQEEDGEVCFDVYFISNDKKVNKLSTAIKLKPVQGELEEEYIIVSEKMWSKPLGSVRKKDDLFSFSNAHIKAERDNAEPFLMEDVSIVISFNKEQKEKLYIFDSINWTNINGLRTFGHFPTELVQFLDSSIEHLTCIPSEKNGKEVEINLKFFNRKEIRLYSPKEISKYLSSGTIKGINIFTAAIVALERGGYIIVDEIENHFNKEIVSTLIRFFMDSDINKAGAVLIFSTHYTELLDIFDRSDNIFITKNKNRIIVENLSDLLDRNDAKKSEFFQSGYLEHTTPTYEAYINLKNFLVDILERSEV